MGVMIAIALLYMFCLPWINWVGILMGEIVVAEALCILDSLYVSENSIWSLIHFFL